MGTLMMLLRLATQATTESVEDAAYSGASTMSLLFAIFVFVIWLVARDKK